MILLKIKQAVYINLLTSLQMLEKYQQPLIPFTSLYINPFLSVKISRTLWKEILFVCIRLPSLAELRLPYNGVIRLLKGSLRIQVNKLFMFCINQAALERNNSGGEINYMESPLGRHKFTSQLLQFVTFRSQS